eukprot:TRINITY_DN92257_c0_g1_i1.p1 TRINITY_DN92257_c0_g1~~TRINITY_DN92257_c0_g1_i1.p1  ORF type:complete len:325 (-),score=49.41 TRINITY_DN92257_c0_g1_i1:37-1011(-)
MCKGKCLLDSTVTSSSLSTCFLKVLQEDVRSSLSLEYLGGPQPVARLACTCRELLQLQQDSRTGRLRVSTASFQAVEPALLALRLGRCKEGEKTETSPRDESSDMCVDSCMFAPSAIPSHSLLSFDNLRVLHVDLFHRSGSLSQWLVDEVLSGLGDSLEWAAFCRMPWSPLPLKSLKVRLSTFSQQSQLLRPGASARAALTRGIAALGASSARSASSLNLTSLELSFLPLRLREILEEICCSNAWASLTFVSVLGSISSLERLVLTHDGIFGDTALQLAQGLAHLPNLRCLDLSRNRISSAALHEVATTLGGRVEVQGLTSQSV